MYVCIYLLIHCSHKDAISISNFIPYLLKYKTRFFLYIWHLSIWGRLKFTYAVPKPDHVDPNQGLHCQIICYLHSSETLCNVDLKFVTNVVKQHIGSIFKSKEIQNTEKSMNELTDKIFFIDAFSIVLFFTEARFGSQLCFYFQWKKHLTWWIP